MDTLWQAQALILLALGVAALAMEVFCLVDAVRYPEQAYVAAGKLTKTWWLVILGVATADATTARTKPATAKAAAKPHTSAPASGASPGANTSTEQA